MVKRALISYWLVASVCLVGCSSSRFHFLESARIAENCPTSEERPPAVQRLLAGHHIERGRALVLVARTWDPGSFFTIDDEMYTKLTIEIAKYEPDVPLKVPREGLRLFYVHGASAWVRQAAGSSSAEATGTILIHKKDDDRLTAAIDVIVSGRDPTEPLDKTPQDIRIRETRTFSRIQLEDLTPWLGTCYPSPSREVYP